jgi:hypothetical protein
MCLSRGAFHNKWSTQIGTGIGADQLAGIKSFTLYYPVGFLMCQGDQPESSMQKKEFHAAALISGTTGWVQIIETEFPLYPNGYC